MFNYSRKQADSPQTPLKEIRFVFDESISPAEQAEIRSHVMDLVAQRNGNDVEIGKIESHKGAEHSMHKISFPEGIQLLDNQNLIQQEPRSLRLLRLVGLGNIADAITLRRFNREIDQD